MAEATPIFATLLKQWRHHRHVSQLDLANQAGVSQRHVSFLETGRANPSRPMVLALASSLDIPLRERNSLLQSAGFSSAFAEGNLDSQSHQVFLAAIQQQLEHHEPYPAIVLDGKMNISMLNQATVDFFGLFVDPFKALVAMGNPTDFQILRLCLHELGLQPYIVNWQELIASFLGRARRTLLANPKHPNLAAFIEEMLNHKDAPADWRKVWSAHSAPAVQMILRKDDQEYRLFTMLAHFGAPVDITLEEISVELFYPADQDTKLALQALAQKRATTGDKTLSSA
ncbi:MAG: helix-turn-helix domain-containing protein [Gammaproteobacteria bacterium]|nr:helix-turn-helix domain-containing protein [Gammaproteobacteria bacterium]